MKYNGIDPTTLHPGISIAKEIPPGAPTSQLETLIGASGEIVAGRTLKQGEYIVRVNIGAKTRKDAWEIREKLAAWACAADTVPHALEPTHWPDRAYDAVLKEITPPEFVFGFGVVDVMFAIPRPIAHSIQDRTATGSGTALTMQVGGTSYARPTLKVTTRSTSRVEAGIGSRTLLGVNYSFSSGDVLTVQMDPPAVWIRSGGREFAADKYVDYAVTDLDTFCQLLTPGSRSIQCAQASGITATWKDEYL